MRERITARGHENVSAEHGSTLEVTTDDWLTEAGDCILGIEADRVPAAFDPAFVEASQSDAARITIRLRVGDRNQTIHARGHPELTFESDRSAVVRTSEYVDDRTVAIAADAAAVDVDRSIVEALQDGATIEIELEVERSS